MSDQIIMFDPLKDLDDTAWDSFDAWHSHIQAMDLEDLQEWAIRLREENRAFFLNEQLVAGEFCVTQKERLWLAERFKTTPHGNQDRADENHRMLALIDMELGVRIGWWEDWDQAGPIDFPQTFKMSQFGDEPQLAHVLVELKIFPSLTQARKNGFDKPLTLGDHVFTKRKIRARVIP